MPSNETYRTAEAIEGAHREAMRGATVGAAKWGLFIAGIGGAAYFYSPVYRNLTIQYKIFLQISGMTIGAAIEGDKRLRAYELFLRARDRNAKALMETERAKVEMKRMIAQLEAEEAAFEASGGGRGARD